MFSLTSERKTALCYGFGWCAFRPCFGSLACSFLLLAAAWRQFEKSATAQEKMSIFTFCVSHERGCQKTEQFYLREPLQHQTALVSVIFYHVSHHCASCFLHKWSAKQHWYLDFHFLVLGDRSRSFKKPFSLIFASRCSVVAKSRKKRSHKKASIFSIFASRSRVVANSRAQRPHKETHATTPKEDDP